MIVSLFSVFDPRTGSLTLNWLREWLFFLVFPLCWWVKKSVSREFVICVVGVLKKEFDLLLGLTWKVGLIPMVISLFVFIVVNNVFGLIPYVFTITAHFSVTLRLALPLWLGLILFGWINQTIHIFAHLVPLGTPLALLTFMVLIETIRSLMRPLTLSLRLGANIIAGHLLLTLLGNQAGLLRGGSLLVIGGQWVLLILEGAVAFIQAYVFVILMTLYFGELVYDKMDTFISYGR